MSLDTGSLLAGYRIDGIAGRGGMGVVYRATELGLERPVALKVIAPELAGEPGFRERFLRESRLAASLDHPAILPVYAAGEAGGDLYLATRYVDGRDLRALLRRDGPLSLERVLDLVGQVAGALDAAHARGLVHRDVKPANVLVDDADHCYLCDFGLTKRAGEGAASTVSAGIVGSLDYLAPEQIRGGEVDGRADQYALACVLYECLAGAPPFRRETEAQTLWAHMHDDPAPLAWGPELDAALARGLAKEPGDRYTACGDLVEAARRALGPGLSPEGVHRRRRRLGRRLAVAGAALLVAGICAAAVLATRGSDDPVLAPENSVAAIDPVTRRVVAAVPVGKGPIPIAASEDWVWTINSEEGAGTISRIDARTRALVSTFSVAGRPISLLAAAGSLWVGTWDGHVLRIDPSTDREEQRWRVPGSGAGDADLRAVVVGSAGKRVWAITPETFVRIAPATSQLVHLRAPARSAPVEAGFGSLWGLGVLDRVRSLVRLAPGTLLREAEIPLGQAAGFPVAGAGRVWIPDPYGRKIWVVDPDLNAVERTYELGGGIHEVAVGAGAVWAPVDDGTVVRIDPVAQTTEPIRIGADYRAQPGGVALGAGLVWVSVR